MATKTMTEAEAVAYVTKHYGAAVAADFKRWLDKALAKDPKASIGALTAAWVLGYALAKATGQLASFLTGGTAVVTNNGQTVATASEGPGVAQAAGQAAANAALSGPFSGLAAIGDFFSRLANPHTWLRVAEVLVGAAFLIIGLNHLLGNPLKNMPKVVPI